MPDPSPLPAPGSDAAAHSARVAARVRERVAAAGGALSFHDYMQLVLYEPGLGYYSGGSTRFGTAGDFTTAPEASDLFGATLARLIHASAPGPDYRVLEVGAGSGRLAVALLRSLAESGIPPREYLVLDVSADLREKQRDRIAAGVPGLAGRVRWLERWPATPIDGFVIANEVLDAMPVERFVIGDDGAPLQLCVSGAGESLALATRPAPAALAAAVAGIEASLGARLPPGYASEVCAGLPAWIAALAGVVERGLVWLSDYGMSRREYYHPQRVHGTFQCHYRQRVHDDALLYPGLTDLSAWVDFSAAADAAHAAGFDVAAYHTQAHFLLAAGLLELLGAAPAPQLAAEARRLTLPGEMGERFKVLTLARGGRELPRDFAARDLRRLL